MARSFSFRIRKQIGALIAYVIVSLFTLSFSSGGFILNFKEIGFSAAAALEKSFFSVKSFFQSTITAVGTLSKLKKEYDDLVVQLENYEALQRLNADMLKENEELKTLLGFSQSAVLRNIPAEIIARDPDALYSALVINKGARDGVKRNMPVIAFQDNNTGLVGKIISVGRGASMIMPVYDYQYYVSSRMEKSRYEGLINGSGSPDVPLSLLHVKKQASSELRYGDVVVTSGVNRNYPKNIPIGNIVSISSPDYNASLEITIEPIIDFSRLEYVFILEMNSLDEDEL